MKHTFTRDFYIPKGSTKVADKQSDAVVYIYEAAGVPYACAFHGKAAKPDWHFRFKTAAQREKRIVEHFENVRAAAVRAKERRAERFKPHTLTVGTILYSSWGYEQTNVDFYQVTRVVGPNTVEIRKIASRVTKETGWASGQCVAVPDHFTGEPMTKRANHTNYVSLTSFSGAGVWDGRPISWSSYH